MKFQFVSWRNPRVKSCWTFFFFKETECATVVLLLHFTSASLCPVVYGISFVVLALCVLTCCLWSFPFSLGSSLRHSKERHWYCCHVCDEAGAHHEVHYPRGHGWYYSHLRPGSSSIDCQQHLRNYHSIQVSSTCFLYFPLTLKHIFRVNFTMFVHLIPKSQTVHLTLTRHRSAFNNLQNCPSYHITTYA